MRHERSRLPLSPSALRYLARGEASQAERDRAEEELEERADGARDDLAVDELVIEMGGEG